MAEVLLFHHAMGQTAGFHAFADAAAPGRPHVHTPDLFDGRTFASIADGHRLRRAARLPALHRGGHAAAEDLPEELVYIGFSLGVVPAQNLAQTRPGARGAVLCYSFVPVERVRLLARRPARPGARHGRRPVLHGGGRPENARELIAAGAPVELFLYPGDQHYFADSSLPGYDPDAAELLTGRVLAFLADR